MIRLTIIIGWWQLTGSDEKLWLILKFGERCSLKKFRSMNHLRLSLFVVHWTQEQIDIQVHRKIFNSIHRLVVLKWKWIKRFWAKNWFKTRISFTNRRSSRFPSRNLSFNFSNFFFIAKLVSFLLPFFSIFESEFPS